jgi:endoglucanase
VRKLFDILIVPAIIATSLGFGAMGIARAAGGPAAGINLSGGEFNPTGTGYGVDYRYPTPTDLAAFSAKGFRIVRLPFLAQRLLSPTQHLDHDGMTDLEEVQFLVDEAAKLGMTVVLDMHEYGIARDGSVIGFSDDSTRVFAQNWARIASAFRARRNVIFGLMNEPHFQTPAMWARAVNATIAAIRATGATQGICVPTTDWSVASRWNRNGNADAMLDVRDPANNFVFELHQYLDRDGAGKSAEVRSGVGSDSLVDFTNWARANGRRGFLGEFAFANTGAARTEADAMLAFMDRNSDVWAGWAYWGGGELWGKYLFALDPSETDGQLGLLMKHAMRGRSAQR